MNYVISIIRMDLFIPIVILSEVKCKQSPSKNVTENEFLVPSYTFQNSKPEKVLCSYLTITMAKFATGDHLLLDFNGL